ncbi:ABC-F family ATP-binding cassette domain-containing protein [Propionispora sp. 2/2-37]|uniref:ABC-F family ATP-binding cassette domain-containing protein n=1 Tax=Propionispora sp. 2/2-37 TaxID=1677858 RepID=UPI0006BB7F02|nr:ABC-F family ATP-binding cassette domain-containing protein [Propionispora sp. 2/2-37]
MGVLRVEGLGKAFGVETLFSEVSFELRRGEKAGLIGGNGTGKTTLLRCLLGLEEADSGSVSVPSGETISYVEQEAELGNGTLYDELCSAYREVLQVQQDMRRLEAQIAAETDKSGQEQLLADYARAQERFEQGGGYEYENRIRRVAFGLGFTDEDLARPLTTFSGGQKTRIFLARALIRQPDFLFLDEPTNHLDIGMVEWLEEYLTGYGGGVLIISHDRYFLDKVVGRIMELENKRLTVYRGNYTEYLEQKAERMAALSNAYEKQQEYIAKTEEYIRRYKAGIKSRQARGRQSQLNRLERIVLPGSEARFDYFAFNPPTECAERVAELLETTAAYGERVILDKISLLIRRGDGVALVGPNGAGKTTLLKLLTGELEASGGRVKLGSRVKLGYFSQEHENLNEKARVLDEIMLEYGLSEERSRHYLGAFLFCGDDVYKIIGELSGGEKARLAFLKLMLTGANFLVLDEPTNHLDIPAKEAVEEAICAFPGTFLAVSHDRYFLDKVANRVVELEYGQLTEYTGNYSYYREKKAGTVKAVPAVPNGKAEKADPKKQERSKRPQDKERLMRKLEEEIAGLEVELKVLEVRLNDPASHTDPAVSRELSGQYDAKQAELAAKYEEWMAVQ